MGNLIPTWLRRRWRTYVVGILLALVLAFAVVASLRGQGPAAKTSPHVSPSASVTSELPTPMQSPSPSGALRSGSATASSPPVVAARPTFVPTEPPSSGPTQILVSVNGTQHRFNSSSGNYSWIGDYAYGAQTLYYTGNRSGSICINLKVTIPGKTIYGDNATETFYNSDPVAQGQEIIDPLNVYTQNYPIKDASWLTSFQFC